MHHDEKGALATEVDEQKHEEAVDDKGLSLVRAGLRDGVVIRTSYTSRTASMKKAASRENREMRDATA